MPMEKIMEHTHKNSQIFIIETSSPQIGSFFLKYSVPLFSLTSIPHLKRPRLAHQLLLLYTARYGMAGSSPGSSHRAIVISESVTRTRKNSFTETRTFKMIKFPYIFRFFVWVGLAPWQAFARRLTEPRCNGPHPEHTTPQTGAPLVV